jgi:hypothetical protein
MLHIALDPPAALALHHVTNAVGMYPQILFPLFATVLEPSPILKVVNAVVKVPVESGIVPTRLLFVRIIEVSALAVLNVSPKKVL